MANAVILQTLIILSTCVLQPGAAKCKNPVTDIFYHLDFTISSHDVAIDEKANVLITGSFSRTADFDPTEGVDLHEPHPGIAGRPTSVFVSKFNSDGSYGWTRTVGGIWYDHGNSIATDVDGNVYTTGSFNATVDFDPSEGMDEHTVLGDLGRTKWFVMKLSPDGSYAWTKTPGDNIGRSAANRIALDAEGNIFITGNFTGSLDFDPGEGVDLHSAGAFNIEAFVTKLFSNGSYAWTRTFGGFRTDGQGIAVDSLGDVIVAGTFRGPVDFDPGEGVDLHTAVRTFGDIFVSKFGSDGSYNWTATFAGFLVLNKGDHVAVTPQDEIVVTGSFDVPYDFDPTDGVDFRIPNDDPEISFDGDIFVTKLFGDGSYGWTYTVGGSRAEGGAAIIADDQGNALVTGWFRSTMDFDAGPGLAVHTPNGTDGLSDIFVMKLGNDAIFHWARTYGSIGEDYVRNIAHGLNGSIYVNGSAGKTFDIDPGCGVDELTITEGVGGSYVARLICVDPRADVDGSGIVDLRDFVSFQACFSGEAPTTCPNGCEVFDFDHDDDIDLDDYADFLLNHTIP